MSDKYVSADILIGKTVEKAVLTGYRFFVKFTDGTTIEVLGDTGEPRVLVNDTDWILES